MKKIDVDDKVVTLEEIEELQRLKQRFSNPRQFRSKGKIGRNHPCPCGSKKKYKKCCLNKKREENEGTNSENQ